MIGASGAVSGVLGAYLVLYPRAHVLVAMPFVLARVPALVMLGLWFAGQLARSLLDRARRRRRRVRGARRRLHRRRDPDSLVSARAAKAGELTTRLTLRCCKRRRRRLSCTRFSEPRAAMASEPVDFSSGAATAQDGAEVIPIVTPTVVAFIGRTERGPLNEPVAVKSFDEFSRVFGGHYLVQLRFVGRAAFLLARRRGGRRRSRRESRDARACSRCPRGEETSCASRRASPAAASTCACRSTTTASSARPTSSIS